MSSNKRAVSLIDKKTGEIAHSITIGTILLCVYQSITLLLGHHVTTAEDVTCMNCAKGVILAGTAGGKVMILSSDNHTIQGQLESGEVGTIPCTRHSVYKYRHTCVWQCSKNSELILRKQQDYTVMLCMAIP